MWFNFSQNRSAEFNREVNWGDATFPVDVTIEGSYEFDIYELAYEYAFLRRENLELSGSFGLHLAQFKVGMSAEVDTGGGSGTAEIGDEGKLNAPLPVIGGRAIWRISGDFWLDAMVQFFALEYENVDGRLIDTRIGVLWQPKKWGGDRNRVQPLRHGCRRHSRPVHRQARLDLRRAADLLQRVVLTPASTQPALVEADRQRAHVPVIGYGRD